MKTESQILSELYDQLSKLKTTADKQMKEISMLASAYKTMRTMSGILTGIVVIESVLLITKLS